MRSARRSSCTFSECPLGATNPTMSMMDAALHWVELGFAVFPLSPRHYAPHPELGYREDGMGGVYWATRDVEQVTRWWTQWQNANIAVATGAPSGGVIAVDVDVPWSIAKNTEAWDILKKLPTDVYETTPSGGRHIFLRVDEEVSNSVKKLAPNVDVRGEVGYVVAAPSVKRDPDSGTLLRYRLTAHPEDIPRAPQSLMDRLRMFSQSENPDGTPKTASDYTRDLSTIFARTKVNEDDLVTHGFPMGSRNSEAHRLACRLWRKHGDDPEYVEAKLHEAWSNTEQEPTPFPWSEVQKASRSARRFIERDDVYKSPTTWDEKSTKFKSLEGFMNRT